MGILTQILGGLAANALGGRQSDGSRRGGMSPFLMALLPVVLKAGPRRVHSFDRFTVRPSGASMPSTASV